MQELRYVYKMLEAIRRASRCEEFAAERISAEALGIDETLWRLLMKQLVKDGYVDHRIRPGRRSHREIHGLRNA